MNRKRRKSEFARCYHSKERVEFVKGLPCVAATTRCIGQPVENSHIENGGAGRKADYDKIVPMCRFHHREIFHQIGRVAFEEMFWVNLEEDAAETERLWMEHQEEKSK